MNDIITAANQAQAADAPTVPTFDAKGYAVSVFEPFKRQISKAKKEAAKPADYDITTGAGMGRAKELRAMFRDIRTSVENTRKERKAPIIEAGKLLDARAAEIKAEVEPFENKYDAEIKAEEQRKEDEKQRKLAEERARVEAIENRIANIRGAASRLASADSEAIKSELNTWTLLRLEPADYQEYLEDALTAVNTTIDQLTNLLAAAEAREAEARRVAAEREELARLRAEQSERDRIAAEQKRQADAAAAESVRQLEEAQAQQAKQQQIMRDIQAIQQRGMVDGDARTLLKTLDEIQALVIDPDYYEGMHSMATMARDMAVSSIGQKYSLRLMSELPAAYEEALAENAQRDHMLAEQRRLAATQGINLAAPVDDLVQVPAITEGDAVVMGVDLAAPGEDATWDRCRAIAGEPLAIPDQWLAPAAVQRPDEGEILDVLMREFNADEKTVMVWLTELVTEQGL